MNYLPDFTLGQFITYKREILGYKKMQFSELMQVGDDTLRSWEKDRFIPAGKNRRKLINILEFTEHQIKKYFKNI